MQFVMSKTFNLMEYTVYLIRKKGMVFPVLARLVKIVKSHLDMMLF